MSDERSLAAAFLLAVHEPHRTQLARLSRLEDQLEELVRVAAAAWPALSVEPSRFVEHLAARLPEEIDPARVFATLRPSDLYLACACTCGAAGAAEALEASCLAGIEPAIARLGLDAGQVKEVKQALRQQLLVGEPGRPPLVGRYGGRGPLAAWVRVVALRVALKHLQRGGREVPVEEQVLDVMPLQIEDAELHYIKERYRGEFQRAFVEALRSLQPRQRNLLLHHYLDGLSTREIGALYRVNQSTAARWLERAREAILTRTRSGLEQRLGADRSEVESIMRLVHSQLDVTLRGLLRR